MNNQNIKSEFGSLNKRSNILRLAAMMKPYVRLLLLAALLVLAVIAAELLKPICAKVVIDDFILGGKEQSGIYSVTGLGIIYFILVLVNSLGGMLQSWLVSMMSQSILNDIRRAVYSRIQSLTVKGLDRYGTGRLITRATNDVDTLNEFYSDVFLTLFRDVFLLIGIVAVMLVLDVRLALVSFVAVPVIALITVVIKKYVKENFRLMKQMIGKINGFFAESIQGMRIIQSFNAEDAKNREMAGLNKKYFKYTMTQVLLNTMLRPTMMLINNFVIALLIAYGYNRITGSIDPLEIGVLYAFTDYVKRFFAPIHDLAEKYTTVQSAFVSCDRIYELLDETDIEDREAGFVGEVSGEIEFRSVWFAYSDENWVLRGISFKIPKGTKAAFVGATGAGKSTIINLITRSYDIQRGEILVDGVNVKDWNLKALRRGIAVVLQDVFLFTGNIKENIDMRGTGSVTELEAALSEAQAADFLSNGLDSPVAEQGLNFSTGERQLLSFARAIAGKPSVLILDEATAHIDTETEEKVQSAIEAASKGRTSIYIAHRLSTIRQSDVIYYLKGGVIAEMGSHDELVALGGDYAALVAAGE